MYCTAGWATATLSLTDFGTRLCPHMDVCNISHSQSQRRTCEGPDVFNSSIRLQILILRRLLMRGNITNLKEVYYSHYRGSDYCTEQEFRHLKEEIMKRWTL